MKVTLREVRDDDLPIFFEQQLDAEAQRMAAHPGRDHEQFMAHWEKIMHNPVAIQNTVVADGEVAGNIGSWEDRSECLVGYWIGRPYWGRGIASAALDQFVAKITTRPLRAHVVKHNFASIRVLEKCGFRMVGQEADSTGTEECVMELSLNGRSPLPGGA